MRSSASARSCRRAASSSRRRATTTARPAAPQSLRSKEQAHRQYRYFPDPDLMPVRVDEAWKDRLRAGLPELPFVKQRRFFEEYPRFRTRSPPSSCRTAS